VRPGWFVSPVLHAAALAATFVVWTQAPPDLKPQTATVPIDIVDISSVSNVAPIASDAEPVEALAPESISGAPKDLPEAIPAPVFKPEPESKPTPPKKPKEGLNLDDLAQLLDKSKPAGARDPQATTGAKAKPGERPRAAVGAGDGLTATEQDAIRAQMRGCWRMPIDMVTPEKLIVKVRVAFAADGAVVGRPEVVSPANYTGADAPTRAAAEAALRAVRLCNPLHVDPARRAGGEMTLNFDPREMIAP
jgi:hypothetical protein